jgi:hypothetical protein
MYYVHNCYKRIVCIIYIWIVIYIYKRCLQLPQNEMDNEDLDDLDDWLLCMKRVKGPSAS